MRAAMVAMFVGVCVGLFAGVTLTTVAATTQLRQIDTAYTVAVDGCGRAFDQLYYNHRETP